MCSFLPLGFGGEARGKKDASLVKSVLGVKSLGSDHVPQLCHADVENVLVCAISLAEEHELCATSTWKHNGKISVILKYLVHYLRQWRARVGRAFCRTSADLSRGTRQCGGTRQACPIPNPMLGILMI